MTFDIQATRDHLRKMDFRALFNELGWNNPKNPLPHDVFDAVLPYTRRQIAELGNVPIFEITPFDGKIPDAKLRKAIYEHILLDFHENLLIFLDLERTQSLWYWIKRELDGKKRYIREHLYVQGQPGDLSLGKLEAMTVDASELNETGDTSVVDVINKLKRAMDTERVTRRFFEAYKQEHERLMHYIRGIDDAYDQRWYASVLINRLMFIYFLQRKSFLDKGQTNYLQLKLKEREGKNEYYSVFLKTLFFEGFAKKERSAEANELLGHIRYLNGGLFLQHQIEQKWLDIRVLDEAFMSLFEFLDGYTWHLDDTPGGKDNDISPHVLGYIFEKYINQKSLGAYYTRPHFTEYLCERTISGYLLKEVNALPALPFSEEYRFETLDELLTNLDVRLCHELLFNILPYLSLLDPACGSGAFLVAALNMLIKIYRAITGQIPYLHDSTLDEWLTVAKNDHKSLNYYIKRKIVTENLYGVDIVDEAVEITKLRLFLALAASVSEPDELEPLPNIDFNIMHGNSLIGLLYVNEAAYNRRAQQLSLFEKSYAEVVAEKEVLIARYQAAPESGEDAQKLRSDIQSQRRSALQNLNELLLNNFNALKIKYEEATWNIDKNSPGKSKRRSLQIQDILTLHPFHWSFEFSKVMARGGFNIIITNPPWEVFKPQAKEFFSSRAKPKQISKNKTRIEDFREIRDMLLEDPKTLQAWLEYLSTFPTQSELFRSAPQYSHQISTFNNQRTGTDINLYKVFTEQCYNLLCSEGLCGIILPGGIYNDLGAKGLREMLIGQTKITGIFGFENRKRIFEDVDSRQKFVVLTFQKGGETQHFPAIFMRQDDNELERFPSQESLKMQVELVHRLSPNSLSIMEFNDMIDLLIVEKMNKHPLLGNKTEGAWKLELSSEFHMTGDSHLFENVQGSDSIPLYEGKMMHQFTCQLRSPRYWIDAHTGREELADQEVGRIEKDIRRLWAWRTTTRRSIHRSKIATAIYSFWEIS
ncbi:MAG: ATP-binding protein [Ktedonobacteraceae bacterium]|nr:ATP-binding protein [Ktedonobacteraceae bacterium]